MAQNEEMGSAVRRATACLLGHIESRVDDVSIIWRLFYG